MREERREAIRAGMRRIAPAISATSKRWWADPAYRERHRAGMVAYWVRRREYQRAWKQAHAEATTKEART